MMYLTKDIPPILFESYRDSIIVSNQIAIPANETVDLILQLATRCVKPSEYMDFIQDIDRQDIISNDFVYEYVRDEVLKQNDPYLCIIFAKSIIDGPFPEAENIIVDTAVTSYLYAHTVTMERFVKAESIIAKDLDLSCLYAIHILKGKFEEAEYIISTSAAHSYRYALNALGDRFKMGETAIYSHPLYKTLYKEFISKKVLTDPPDY